MGPEILQCLILGDSIAVGIGDNRPDCKTVAVVGISSGAFVNRFWGVNKTKVAVISLGSNDDGEIAEHLMKLRRTIEADNVYWILPNNKQLSTVMSVAFAFNDKVLSIPELSPDKVHPTDEGYKVLSESF